MFCLTVKKVVQQLWEQFKNFVCTSTTEILYRSPKTTIFGVPCDQCDNTAACTCWYGLSFIFTDAKYKKLWIFSLKIYVKSLLKSLHYNVFINFEHDKVHKTKTNLDNGSETWLYTYSNLFFTCLFLQFSLQLYISLRNLLFFINCNSLHLSLCIYDWLRRTENKCKPQR